MTSQSRKKRPTTQPNTGRSNPRSGRASIDRACIGRGVQRNRTKRGVAVVTSLLFAGLLPAVVHAEDAVNSKDRSSRFDPASAEARWEKLRAAYLGRSRKPQLVPTKEEVTETAPQPALPSVRWEKLDPEELAAENAEPQAAAEEAIDSIAAPTEPSEQTAVVDAVPQADYSAFDSPEFSNVFQTDSSRSSSVQSADFETTATETIRPAAADPRDLYQPPAITESPVAAGNEQPYFTPTFEDEATAEDRGWSDAPIDLSDDDGGYLTPIPMVAVQDGLADASSAMDISDRLTLKPLSSIVPSADYSPTADDACQYICPTPEGCPDNLAGECPPEIPLPNTVPADRFFGESMTHWTASNLCYNPLYFEDPSLERYGQHIIEPVQSIKSVALFAGQFVSLPYLMALDPAHSAVSPLGFYRPGEAAPRLRRAIPLNKKAAATSIGAYTGLIFLIP